MPVVTNTVTKPGGGVFAGARVRIRLYAAVDGTLEAAYDVAADRTIVSELYVLTDAAGDWAVDLQANATITPANTVYEIVEAINARGEARYYVSVPNTAGPHWTGDLLVIEPSPVPVGAETISIVDDDLLAGDVQSALTTIRTVLKALGVTTPRSGRRYGFLGGANGNGIIANGADNRLVLLPVPVFYPTTFVTAHVDVRGGASAGGTVRFGVYSSDATGWPTALLLDSGAIDATTPGDKSVAFTSTLAAGLYWAGGCTQGGASTKGNYQRGGLAYQQGHLATILGFDSDVEAAPSVIQNGVSAALPATFGGVLSGTAELAPIVTLRT